jgi:hypothetical protein
MAKKPHPTPRRRAPAVTPRDVPIAPAVQSAVAERPATRHGAPRWIVAALALLVAAGVGARRTDAPEARETPVDGPVDSAVDAGPARSPHAGVIELREVWLHPPDAHIRPSDCDALFAAWGAPNRAGFDAAMTRGGLDAMTRAAVLAVTACDVDGCIAAPPDAVLAGLTPAQRVGVFRAMREYPQAMSLNAPFVRPASRQAFCDDPGLSGAAREVLRAGSFVDGDTRYFSDLTWLCHRVTDTAERRAFFRTLRAGAALDATVRVRSAEALERAVAWWGVRGREDAVRARLLASMRDGDAGVALRELLPPFARERLGTFPPRDTRFDCFWTALNFFSPTGEGGALMDAEGFDAAIARWGQVPLNQLRFGDVLVFRTEAGATEHAAVYLAEDLVFAKDGWSMHRAWELVRIARERRAYAHAPRIVAYRPP